MTRFTVVSILPEIVDGALAVGVVGRARAAGGLPLAFINPRDFTHDRHRSVDDTPYGGGPGMVMRCEPLAAAIDAAGPGHRVFLGPGGAPLTQATVRRLATLDPFNAGTMEAALRALAEERGVKTAALIHATRVAVTGQAVSPGIFDVLQLVGRDRVLLRLSDIAVP